MSTESIADICRLLMPEYEPVTIASAVPESPERKNVYRISDQAGREILLKVFPDDGRRGSDADALATEAAVLKHLHRLGCPVPELIAADFGVGAMATEWLPGDTLESRLQCGAVSPEEGKAVVRALAALDTAFQRITGAYGRGRAGTELSARTREEISDLAAGPPWFIRPGSVDVWVGALDEAYEQIIAGHWSHGSLDCSASNVILAEGKAYVIDLSILGADWRERRAVRYGIATGSGRSNGKHRTIFDGATASFYCEVSGESDSSREVAARLDLHHLLVLLQALDRLGEPEGKATDLLALAHLPLAPNPVADSLRSLLVGPALQ